MEDGHSVNALHYYLNRARCARSHFPLYRVTPQLPTLYIASVASLL